MFRKHSLFVLFLGGLAACAPATPMDQYRAGKPLSTFYRPGASLQQIDATLLDCQIEAAQRVPARTVISQSPSWRVPVRTVCNTDGNRTICRQTGGETYGGEIRARDANDGLRERAFAQCMARTGHFRASIPACPEGTAPMTGGPLPQLTERVCYIPSPDNISYIVGNRY